MGKRAKPKKADDEVTKSITLLRSKWDEVIDCQHDERLSSQVATIRLLIDEGLAVLKNKRGGGGGPGGC